jgi:hypothetical protein
MTWAARPGSGTGADKAALGRSGSNGSARRNGCGVGSAEILVAVFAFSERDTIAA